MPMRIEDGKGGGTTAEVDSRNRLVAKAITNTAIMDAADEGDAYLVVCHHTLVSANWEEVCYFINTASTKHVHVNRFVQAIVAATHVETAFFFATERTSGGALKVPVNSNQRSANTSGLVVYDNSTDDLILITDNDKETGAFVSPTFSGIASVEDGVIHGANDTLSLRAKGTIGDTIALTIYFFEQPSEF